MGRLGKITRRSLLIGSAAIAGGVAFGIWWYRNPADNPLLERLGEGEAAITPHVKIDSENITLITPRADLGQGAYAVQAALIAEELDVTLDQVTVTPGTPSLAYINDVALAEALPLAATSEGALASGGRLFASIYAKAIGAQITGGSSTVPDAYEKLRMAGAVARATLLEAAAMKSGHDLAQLKTDAGKVILPDGSALTYQELAPIAATIEPVTDIRLKPESEWKLLGKEMRRLDIVAKSTGTLNYGIDMRMDGMVYATVRTNPHLGGAVRGFDAERAEKMPGVLKIAPVTGGAGVVADNTWRAFRAAAEIEFDWAPGPYPPDSAGMWKEIESSFTSSRRETPRFRDDGDVEVALAEGNVVEAEYRTPFLAHAPLEPMNATVLFKDGKLDVWTGTQIPLFMIGNIERFHGIAAENIRVHDQYTGGSFGRRLEDDFVHQAIEVALAMEGTPVKMTWTREEDMTHDFPRTLQMARGRGAFRDGKVTAYDLSIASMSTTVSQAARINQIFFGPDIVMVAGAWDQPYSIPNYRVTGYRAPPMVPVSSWRSVGASGNGFLHDCFLDELIYAAGADPLAERIRLCWHEPSRKVLEAVGEMSDWGSDPGPNRGRGVAFCLSFGVPVAEVVEVTATGRGIRIDKVFVAAEVGKVLDPVNFDNQVKGGVVWGLGHAMNCELTYENGAPTQTNFHAYEGMRLYQCPEIVVRGLENGKHVRGIGEPPVPPAAPALANAIFAATGKRIRELPLARHIDFV